MPRVAVLGLVCACGRVGFDDVTGVDSRGLDGGMIEATSCWSAWDPESLVLDAPVMLDTLVDGTQRLANPVLSPTSLVLSYVSNTGAGDIMSATRTAIDQPWIPAGPITELDTTEEEGRFVTTLDGLVGIYVRGNPTRLVETRRATSRDPWGPPSASPFVDNTSAANFYDPEIARDGLRVYYSNGADILVATRTSRDAAFAGPTVVDITGTTSVADPVLSPDERVLVHPGEILPGHAQAARTGPFQA